MLLSEIMSSISLFFFCFLRIGIGDPSSWSVTARPGRSKLRKKNKKRTPQKKAQEVRLASLYSPGLGERNVCVCVFILFFFFTAPLKKVTNILYTDPRKMTGQQSDITASPTAERKGCLCCAEFSIGMFELKERGGKVLDLDRLLNIGKGVLSLPFLLKVIFLGVSIYGLVADITHYEHPDFYLAYLTSWTMVHCVTYLTASLLLTILPASSPSSGNNSYLMKFTWLYCSLTVVHGTIVTVLYWGLLYEPGDEIGHYTVMTHGVVALLCVLNGLVLDRTPIRLKHVFINWVWGLLYLLWNVLHNKVIQHK